MFKHPEGFPDLPVTVGELHIKKIHQASGDGLPVEREFRFVGHLFETALPVAPAGEDHGDFTHGLPHVPDHGDGGGRFFHELPGIHPELDNIRRDGGDIFSFAQDLPGGLADEGDADERPGASKNLSSCLDGLFRLWSHENLPFFRLAETESATKKCLYNRKTASVCQGVFLPFTASFLLFKFSLGGIQYRLTETLFLSNVSLKSSAILLQEEDEHNVHTVA